MTIIIESSSNDLCDHPPIKSIHYIKLNASSGADISRLIIENITLDQITLWAAAAYSATDVIKKMANNLKCSIEDAEKIYKFMRKLFKFWSKKDNSQFIVMQNGSLVLSSDMSIESRADFYSKTFGAHNDNS